MLTVWLIRGFTHDLAEFLGGAEMDREIKRHLGIGNATGLGMAPFLVSHPRLLDAWFRVKEPALARVLAQETIFEEDANHLLAAVSEAKAYLADWQVADLDAQSEIDALREEWDRFTADVTVETLRQPRALAALFAAAETRSEALQELTAAWLLEPFGALIDGLAADQATHAEPRLDASMSCAALKTLIESQAGWALDVDFADPAATAQFWYVSEEKLEPRLGDRESEAGAELETPLDSARQLAALYRALPSDDRPLWRFLAEAPEHRAAARRVQTLAEHPYSEVRANLLDKDAAPIRLLRAKLSFFGATRFDPKSRLWTRVTLGQGLPLLDEIGDEAPWLPSL